MVLYLIKFMTSDELNNAIRTIADDETIDYECFGGKKIPYLGWFWRTVDFDRFIEHGYRFGVVPASAEDELVALNGFMENNKWDYGTVRATPEQCKAIHQALINAVTTRDINDLRVVNDLIQAVK